jgi:hypothetical protein
MCEFEWHICNWPFSMPMMFGLIHIVYQDGSFRIWRNMCREGASHVPSCVIRMCMRLFVV